MKRAERIAQGIQRTEACMFLALHGCTLATIAKAVGIQPKTARDRLRVLGIECTDVIPRSRAKRVWADLPNGRPNCMGHRFGPENVCICNVTWEQHQLSRLECGTDHSLYCYSGHLKADHWRAPPRKRGGHCGECRRMQRGEE